MSFFRGLFGPSRDEIWQQVAEDMGGEFLKGGLFTPAKLEVKLREWTITLDTYTVNHGKSSSTYTRIRAPFKSNNGFRFKVYSKGIFSDIGKMMGMQDIQIGVDDFDEKYIIKGNDEEKVKALIINKDLRALINGQPKISLEIKDKDGAFNKVPEGVDIIYFNEAGVIKDVERLKQLFLLFANTLDHLCKMGVASEEYPGMKL